MSAFQDQAQNWEWVLLTIGAKWVKFKHNRNNTNIKAGEYQTIYGNLAKVKSFLDDWL